MTSPTFTLPLEEWIKSIRAEWRLREPFIAGALSRHAQEELALAAIAVLAPMLGEECAKVADVWANTEPNYEQSTNNIAARALASVMSESGKRIAAAIRSKFPPATGEK